MNRKFSMFPSMMLRAAGHSGASNVLNRRWNIFGVIGLVLWICLGNNSPNSTSAGVEHFGEFSRGCSLTIEHSHLSDNFPRQFLRMPSFNAAISRVIEHIAKPQVIGTHTQTVVTCMQYPLTFWDCTKMHYPTADMRIYLTLANATRNSTTPGACNSAYPQPATIAFGDFFPKPISKSDVESNGEGRVLRLMFSGHNQVMVDCVQCPLRPLIVTGTFV